MMKKNKLLTILLCSAVLLAACDKSLDSSGNAGAGGSTARMAIYGNYLYVVNNSELETYDITNPSQTVLLNSQNVGWNIETIFPYRDKLFIGSQTGMFIFDNSNPKKPVLQGQAQHLRACDPVVADDDYAYVTLRSNNNGCGGTLNQLNIYNITGNAILSPQLTSTLIMPEPNGVGIKDTVVYVCMGNIGMNIVNASDKQAPKIIKTLTDNETYIDVIPWDDLLITYVTGGIILYDISNPANPVKKSTIKN
ncbi:MAG: LVIVD repeat-containing protein [Niabella sp.]